MRAARLALSLASPVLVLGCAGTPLREYAELRLTASPARAPSGDFGEASRDGPPLSEGEREIREALAHRPSVRLPATLAVALLGDAETETAPRVVPPGGGLDRRSAAALEGFGADALIAALAARAEFRRVWSLNALGISDDFLQDRIDLDHLRGAAARVGADLLLVCLVRTNRYRWTNAWAFLDWTVLAALWAPSRELEAWSGGKAVLVDVRTGGLVLAVEARERRASRAAWRGSRRALERLAEGLEGEVVSELAGRVQAQLGALAELAAR